MQEASKLGVSEYRALFVYDKIAKSTHPKALFEEEGAKSILTCSTLEKIALMFNEEIEIVDTEGSKSSKEDEPFLEPDYWAKYGEITTRGFFAHGGGA